jgi:hypothetical protein
MTRKLDVPSRQNSTNVSQSPAVDSCAWTTVFPNGYAAAPKPVRLADGRQDPGRIPGAAEIRHSH